MSQLMTQVAPEASEPKFLHHFCAMLRKGWMFTFPQKRTREKAIDLAVTAMIIEAHRHTISQSIVANDNQQRSWTPFYRFFSRSRWQTRDLFRPCLENALAMLGPQVQWIPMAVDDTKVYKTGKNIEQASWMIDSLSPKFRANLRWGLRFLQASILLPLYRTADTRARAIPVRFELVPVVKKPGKRASEEDKQAAKQARKKINLTTQTAAIVREIRTDLDRAGAANVRLLEIGDGSFCNKGAFASLESCPRTDILVRCRKDASLCMPAQQPSKKVYGTDKFTPDHIREDKTIPWQSLRVHYGGQWRNVDIKRVDGVMWQRGAKRRLLSVFIVRPIVYRVTKAGKELYRQPAYLMTTATNIGSQEAIQMYCDRWQIEVNHREEKHDLGVGQAQVRNPQSVARHPAFVVAAYSMMQLAAIQCHGPTRAQRLLICAQVEKRPSNAIVH